MADATERERDSTVASGEDELAGIIGANLRRLRTQRNLTLEALARLSNVSKSMLGEIELGRTTPNISLLWRVANALDTSVPVFLQKWSAPEIQIFRGDAEPAEGLFCTRPLGPAVAHNRARFHQITLAPECEEPAETCPAGTMVNLVVSDGALDIRTGAESHHLGAGDAAYFPATLPLVYHNPGAVTAVVYRVTIYPVAVHFS